MRRGLVIVIVLAGLVAAGCSDDRRSAARAPVRADEAAIQAIERDLAPVLSRSSEGLVVHRLRDGGERIDLGGRFQSAAIARIGPDGRVITGCVDSVEQADAFLRATVPAKAASDR